MEGLAASPPGPGHITAHAYNSPWPWRVRVRPLSCAQSTHRATVRFQRTDIARQAMRLAAKGALAMRFGVPGPLWAESSPCECAGAPKLALIGQNVNFNGVSALLAAELAAQLHRQAHILTIVTGDAGSGRRRRCTGAVCASQSALLRKV